MVTSEYFILQCLECVVPILNKISVTLYVLVIVGEAANFVAYIYAPAVLVTPLGALSIIIRYVCDHIAQLLSSVQSVVTCDIL